jgi:hypothetical protein
MKKSCMACGAEFNGAASRKYCGRSCAEKMHPGRTPRHGLSDNPEHRTWTRIRERCNNPSHGDYARYGGRGIKVCARWDAFENFLADMGPRNGMTIERNDNDGNYEPSNCRWATRTEQAQNKSNTYTAEQDQKIRDAIARGCSFREMADHVGKSVSSVTARAYRLRLKSGRPATRDYGNRAGVGSVK